MGVQGFQEYIEKHCPNTVVPVELQKLARGSNVMIGGGRQRPPQSPLRLLVDAENCLHRLYGGFYTDWISGGQWNHMLGYLDALSKACFNGNIELLVCFNGALEKGRLHEWVKRQVNERQSLADHQPRPKQGHPAAQSLVPSPRVHDPLHPIGPPQVPRRGNHILPDEDLAAFHWKFTWSRTPISVFKVRLKRMGVPAAVPSPKKLDIPQVQHSYPEPLVEHSLALEQNSFSNIPHEGQHTPLYERSFPINPGQAGSPKHTEAAFFNASFTSSSSEKEESSGTTAKER